MRRDHRIDFFMITTYFKTKEESALMTSAEIAFSAFDDALALVKDSEGNRQSPEFLRALYEAVGDRLNVERWNLFDLSSRRERFFKTASGAYRMDSPKARANAKAYEEQLAIHNGFHAAEITILKELRIANEARQESIRSVKGETL
jgi:hypothetical protein